MKVCEGRAEDIVVENSNLSQELTGVAGNRCMTLISGMLLGDHCKFPGFGVKFVQEILCSLKPGTISTRMASRGPGGVGAIM